MKIEQIQRLIDATRKKKYLKLYPPIYNENIAIPRQEPEIYNKFGEKMDAFFIRDRHISLSPYGTNPNYFLWDRFNYSLPVHFYTGNAMHKTYDTADKKFSMLLEPRVKQPKDYLSLQNNKILKESFTNIITHDEILLDKLDNAIFFPSCAASWVDNYDKNMWQRKTKNISMLSSHKKMCPLHYLRINVANTCKSEGLADTFGTFDGGKYVTMQETLEPYRYSICFENQVSAFFYTERIISAFLTHTVPIYLGATQIDKFFNPDGIIQINEKQAGNIKEVLKQCSEFDYEQRLPAVIDNYNRALGYLNLHDLLYETVFLKPEMRKLKTNFDNFNKGKIKL